MEKNLIFQSNNNINMTIMLMIIQICIENIWILKNNWENMESMNSVQKNPQKQSRNFEKKYTDTSLLPRESRKEYMKDARNEGERMSKRIHFT